MAKLKTYTENQERELRVVARSPRNTWRLKIIAIQADWTKKGDQRSYSALFAKTSELAKEEGNPPDPVRSAISSRARKKRKASEGTDNLELVTKPVKERKKYKTRKYHDSPLRNKELNVSSKEVRFRVKGIRFEVMGDDLELVVNI